MNIANRFHFYLMDLMNFLLEGFCLYFYFLIRNFHYYMKVYNFLWNTKISDSRWLHYFCLLFKPLNFYTYNPQSRLHNGSIVIEQGAGRKRGQSTKVGGTLPSHYGVREATSLPTEPECWFWYSSDVRLPWNIVPW